VRKAENDFIDDTRQHGLQSDVLKRLFRNRLAIIGSIIIFGLLVTTILGEILFDYKTDIINQDIPNRLQSPSLEHIFGTDDLGRDVFARIIYGTRYSLFIALLANLGGIIIGSALGALAGYFGSWTDMIIMRFTDIFLAIPYILLAIAIVAALGSSIPNLVIALVISGIPVTARMMRGSVLTVRDLEYVEAAKAIGAKHLTIIWQHILPNCIAPIIVHATLWMAVSITSIAALSFLGLGIQPPAPEWGAMLSSGRNYIRGYGYLTVFPGLAIMITALAFNLLGDGLRDALDPRLK
jgi:peptide/nickel transport system permease protein